MNYIKLAQYISHPRLNRFLHACGNSQSKAQNLYAVNLRIARAFYPVLNLFETFLRNSVNNQLTRYYGTGNWIIREKNGFMNHSSLSRDFFLKKSVEKAIGKISAQGSRITAGKVIAEQPFGFWVSLYYPSHFSLMGGSPLFAFPNKPTTTNRIIISNMLYDIQQLRNRIYHNEPICFNLNNMNFTKVQTVRQYIYDLSEWIDTDIPAYINTFDDILFEIAASANI